MARLLRAVTLGALLLLCLPRGAMALEYRADLGNVVTIEDPQLVERVAQPVASVARIRNLISGLSVAGVEPRTSSQMLDFDRSGSATIRAQ